MTIVGKEDEPQLQKFVTIVRRYKLLIAMSTLALLVASIVMSTLSTPVYRSDAQLLLRAQTNDPLNRQVSSADAPRLLNNEVRLIVSQSAREAVLAVYDGPLDVKDVKASIGAAEADVIDVTVKADDATDAAELANVYMEAYVAFRKDQDVGELRDAIAKVQVQLDGVAQQITDISAPLTSIDQRIASVSASELPALLDARREVADGLESQLDALQADQRFYQEEIDRLELSAGIAETGSLRVLRSAEVPDGPESPAPVRSGAIAIAAGLLLGVGVAIAKEELDRTVKGHGMLQRLTALPALGRIPGVSARVMKGRGILLETAPTSGFAEAVRSLRTAISHRLPIGPEGTADGSVVLITSPSNGEGKTVIATSLAYAFAAAGETTVLVNCDLRRGDSDRGVVVSDRPGLTELLSGDAELDDVLVPHSSGTGLILLGAGQVSSTLNPTEAFASARFEGLVKQLAARFERVVLDAPPVLPVSDALMLATRADAVLVVVAERKTSTDAVERAFELLAQVDAPVRGTVLNYASTEEALYVERGRSTSPTGAERAVVSRVDPSGRDPEPPGFDELGARRAGDVDEGEPEARPQGTIRGRHRRRRRRPTSS